MAEKIIKKSEIEKNYAPRKKEIIISCNHSPTTYASYFNKTLDDYIMCEVRTYDLLRKSSSFKLPRRTEAVVDYVHVIKEGNDRSYASGIAMIPKK